MLRHSVLVVGFAACCLACSLASAQSPGALYTWNGTGNARGWFKNFGTNTVTLANSIAGELTVTETGAAGTGEAISDDFNNVFEGAPGVGGLDLTGLSSIQFDMGHSGVGAVSVQFFVQASPDSNYVALGPDQNITPGIATYTAPLASLSLAQRAYIRTIGINIRDHIAEGNLAWTLQEVRSAGTALISRDFATHDAGSSDGGLQGAIVNFDNAAVMGNDGGQNQTGLSQNLGGTPPGNTGSLRWTDLAGGNGAAVSYANGTVFRGNTFNERPTDMSNYRNIVLRMAATNVGGNVASVDVQYFLQSGGFNFHSAGPDQTLPADGEYHYLCFPLAGTADLDFVEQHGINLRAHAGGDLIIDVDNIRATAAECPSPDRMPAMSLAGWTAACMACLGLGWMLLQRKPAPAA